MPFLCYRFYILSAENRKNTGIARGIPDTMGRQNMKKLNRGTMKKLAVFLCLIAMMLPITDALAASFPGAERILSIKYSDLLTDGLDEVASYGVVAHTYGNQRRHRSSGKVYRGPFHAHAQNPE